MFAVLPCAFAVALQTHHSLTSATALLRGAAPSGRRVVLEGLLLTEVNDDNKIEEQNWYWAPRGIFSLIPELDSFEDDVPPDSVVDEDFFLTYCERERERA